jgi:hypothetical protein
LISLLADLGGDADHGAILDVGMRDPLELPGRDISPPAAEAVGHAPEKSQVARGIEPAEIAGPQRAVAQRVCGRCGIAGNTREQRLPLERMDDELAALARRDRISGGIARSSPQTRAPAARRNPQCRDRCRQ